MEGHSMDCSLRSSGPSVGPEAQPATEKTTNSIKITLNIDIPLLNIPNTQDMFNRNLWPVWVRIDASCPYILLSL